MIRHLIVFNKREDASEEECQKMGDNAKAVLPQIPGVIRVSFGTAVQEKARYRYYLFVDFSDRSVIQSYQEHELHIRFANEEFRPMAADRITTDYEIIY